MSRWIIHWWAKTGARRKKFGMDVVSLEMEELSESEADDILSDLAACRDTPKVHLPNFEDYYLNADICESFGVVKVVKV